MENVMEEEVLMDEPIIEEQSNLNYLIGDNWYKAYPDKILGKPYEASGRFGKVTKYAGDMSVLSGIDVEEYFIGANKQLNDPLASVTNSINISAEIQKPEVAQIIIEALKKSDKELASIRKKKLQKVDEDAVVTPIGEINSFKSIFKALNPEISKEEIEVYTWHKSYIGKPLSKNYVALFKDDLFSEDEELRDTYIYRVPDHVITGWIERGLLFYYRGELLPDYEYLSGDMYDKKMQLTQEQDDIVAKYGQDVYDRQVLALQNAYRMVYDKRLVLGGENSLVILANSKLAKTFMIQRIVDIPEDKQFKIKSITAASDDNYGKPDFINDYKAISYKKQDFEELSLADAFSWWVLNSRPALKEPITHLDIVKYYVMLSPIRVVAADESYEAKKAAEAKKEKLKSSTQREGQRLFGEFLETQLLPNDKIRLETQWNVDYNNHLPVNLNKVPVAFTMAKYIMGKEEIIPQPKRDAVAFTMNNGTGVLAYDVGVGKTPSAIYTISAFMDAGYCKHPLIVVPNQVYKQFISEIKMFTPHIPVIEGYNLSKEYIENFKDAEGNIAPPPSGAITIITYEGFENIAFNENTQQSILNSLYDILNQGGEDEKSEKNKASFFERIEKLVGRGLQGSVYSIEDFGFDFICYDEAHKMKKVFTSVKGETDDKGKRGKNPYAITSGSPSSIGLKGFMINYYILKNNGYKNILLLTATPFTNSPLEIFSMLSMVAYEQLQKTNLNNLKTFFDTYVQASTELVINSKLKPEFKQVILGFNNLISLQSLIRRFILYKTGEEVNIIRPKKYVLPYLKDIENGIVIDLPLDKRVETYISMTPQQAAMMEDIIRYVEDGTRIGSYKSDESDDVVAVDEEDVIDVTSGVEVDESSLNDDEKRGVRTIKGLSYSRNLALSPHLYTFSGLPKPDYKTYIQSSPKLTYVVECIRSVRDYCLSKNEPVAGQVIYMDRGIEFFGLIREYLIKEVGYEEHEVGIIRSGLPKNGRTSKEYVKNLFNGEIYNDKTKQFESVTDNARIKVVIGSSTIKEGINLQKYGAVLYNCFIDWNPTDIQQLEGRIYRQKNTFSAVRIVNPLVVDSADIFLFQKLQEKTARLNTIWATDGRTNVLHTEEFNSEELKYALIRNPNVIAELRIIEQKARLESEIIGLDRQLEIADRVINAAYDVNSKFTSIEESIRDYRNFTPTGNKLADASKLVQLANDAARNQKDKDGKKILPSWKRRYEEYDLAELSPIEREYSKPYYFDTFAVATRDLNRYINDFINQYKIPFSLEDYQGSLDAFKNGVNAKKTEIDEKIKALDSKEYKEQMVQEAFEEKERQKIEYKPLPQIISEFSRLNYLLSEKVVKENKATKVYTSCPPMGADGLLDISDEALKSMEECLSKEPQTKDLYFNGQEYVPERNMLHENIINKLFEGVKCVKNEKPIAVFTGGSPASGKSSFLKKNSDYLLSDEIFHLDADEIRAMLPEYQGWNANSTHLETQDIVNEILSMIGSETCRYDLIYDGTMNRAKKYFELIKKVKNLGYETYIIFMVVPYSEARKRALGRYQRTGRFVPMEVIDDFFTLLSNGKTKGEDALDQLKPLVDGWVVADGLTGNIIDRGGKGIPSSRSRSVYGKPLLEIKEPNSETTTEQEIKDLSTRTTYKQFLSAIKAGQGWGYTFPKDKLTEIFALIPNDIDGNIKKIANYYYSHGKDARKNHKEQKAILKKEASQLRSDYAIEQIEKQANSIDNKEKTDKLIKTLNLSVKYTDGEEKASIEKQIKALTLSLKYR